MDERRSNHRRIIIGAVVCLAASGMLLGLWLHRSKLLLPLTPKITYQEICEDPKKIGSPVSDVMLPEHLYQAVDVAEGDDAAFIVARARVSKSLPMPNGEWHARNALMALYYWSTTRRRTLVEFVANCLYFGRNATGVASAAQVFLGKQLSQVTMAEAAMLAALLKAPSAFDPSVHPKRAKQRRDMILDRIFERGIISESDLLAAKAEPVSPQNTETRQPQ